MKRKAGAFVDVFAGAVLLAATAVALVWANSPWSASYDAVWNAGNLRHWVNDGLMALFFFVVGLEIKRELVRGELRDGRTAMLPAVAALGGMAAPALLYLAVTVGSGASHGWGIPMATDIAFALGVLGLCGRRLPASLKTFLLTLAVVDDIGAIAVIAVFYADGLRAGALVLAVVLLGALGVLRRHGVTWLPAFLVLGVGVWLATYASGVHATIAGVALGLVAPAEQWEERLRPWTSFVVVPVFALANAGVGVTTSSFGRVSVAVIIGLVAGKLVGISAAVGLAVVTGAGRLPEGATAPMLVSVAAVGGVGFTVSLFIAELAFAAGPLREEAKLGVLAGSALAALIGGVALRATTR